MIKEKIFIVGLSKDLDSDNIINKILNDDWQTLGTSDSSLDIHNGVKLLRLNTNTAYEDLHTLASMLDSKIIINKDKNKTELIEDIIEDVKHIKFSNVLLEDCNEKVDIYILAT